MPFFFQDIVSCRGGVVAPSLPFVSYSLHPTRYDLSPTTPAFEATTEDLTGGVVHKSPSGGSKGYCGAKGRDGTMREIEM